MIYHNTYYVTKNSTVKKHDDVYSMAQTQVQVQARLYEYDYDILPLKETQRELLSKVKDVAPIAVWRFLQSYRGSYQRYVYAQIMRLAKRKVLTIMYDGLRGGKRIHLTKLLVRPGEIYVMPDDDLMAWRKGGLWYIKTKWAAAVIGRRRVRLALPNEVLQAAGLPERLYKVAVHDYYGIRYIIAAQTRKLADALTS